jgi:hypothetical protein
MGQKGVATWHHYSRTVIPGVKSYFYIPSKRQSISRVSTVARQARRPGQATNLTVELAKNKAVGISLAVSNT